jgi:hypothetical protein
MSAIEGDLCRQNIARLQLSTGSIGRLPGRAGAGGLPQYVQSEPALTEDGFQFR